MRILITGGSGMAGAWLLRHLWATEADVAVHALVRSTSRSQVLSSSEWAKIVRHIGDLTDSASVDAAFQAAQPDRVWHLGAQSFVASSWQSGQATLEINVLGTFNVLNAARKIPGCRVLVASSSEAYGAVLPESVPIREDHPFNCLSPYGVGKAATDMLGYQFWRSYGLHCIRARAFNHCGPGRDSRFAEGSWARQIAEAEAGFGPTTIKHGSLLARRDYVDVRDTVAAYVALLEHGEPGQAYNIASGTSWSMADVLHGLVKFAKVAVTTQTDPTRMRPSDVPLLEGDSGRLRAAIPNWHQKYDFLSQTLPDLLDWHREQVARNS